MKAWLYILVVINFNVIHIVVFKNDLISQYEDKLMQNGDWSLTKIETQANTLIAIHSSIALRFNSSHTGIRIEKYPNFDRSTSFAWSIVSKDDDVSLKVSECKIINENKKRSKDVTPPLGEPEFNTDVEFKVKFLEKDKILRLSYDGALDKPAKICYFKLN